MEETKNKVSTFSWNELINYWTINILVIINKSTNEYTPEGL